MARPKKDGNRAPGVQAKKGNLYIVTSRCIIEDDKIKSKKVWVPAHLKDTPENVKKAIEMRNKQLHIRAEEAVDPNVLMSTYTDEWLEKIKRKVADTTYYSYLYRSKRIKDYFIATKVRNIKEADVERFLDDLFEVYDIQPRTVKDTRAVFSNIMEQACRDGIIEYNPVKEAVINKALLIKHTKNKEIEESFFSYEEAILFLEAAKKYERTEENSRGYCNPYEMFYLTLFFGLRREELLGLRWDAIDFRKREMRINHTVTRGTKVNRENSTKTLSSERKYPLSEEQIEMFKALKAKETKLRKLFGNGYIENDYIFKENDGSLHYPDYPTKVFKKILKMTPELPQKVTLHGLRRSCVSMLVHEGKDIKSIQNWVGHKDINTTLKIYAMVKDNESKNEISQSISNMLPLRKY